MSIIVIRGDEGCVLKRDFIFYTIASTVIAVIAQLLGAGLPVILFSALLIPPILLLIIRIVR